MSTKILSLDGGGTWAVLQAMALGDLYGPDTPGRDILARFDVVAATSGGSLVLAGLLCHLTPGELVGLFGSESQRKMIFARTKGGFGQTDSWYMNWWLMKWIPRLLPRWSTEKKREGLKQVFEEIVANTQDRGKNVLELPLSKIVAAIRSAGSHCPEVVITGFDYDTRRAVFFRSNTNSRCASNPGSFWDGATLLDAIHVSSNAPAIFFDEPATVVAVDGQKRYGWDGGVGGYGNPLLAGVVESMANYSEALPQTFACLSIGTGNTALLHPKDPGVNKPPEFFDEHKASILSNVLPKMAQAILDDPPDAATYHAFIMTGGKPPMQGETLADVTLVRLNPLIRPIWDTTRSTGAWRVPIYLQDPNPNLDHVSTFHKLAELDMDVVEANDFNLVMNLGAAWLNGKNPNQPIQGQANTHLAKIGHDLYSTARARWMQIAPDGVVALPTPRDWWRKCGCDG